MEVSNVTNPSLGWRHFQSKTRVPCASAATIATAEREVNPRHLFCAIFHIQNCPHGSYGTVTKRIRSIRFGSSNP